MTRNYRIALLTHGFELGGGVPSVARWLRDGLHERSEYVVDIVDLATSRRDQQSRRVIRPATWMRRSLHQKINNEGYSHWGANAVEIEFMRYRPRLELTRFLRGYDLVQVVSGTPAWAKVARHSGVPVVVHAATTALWERQSILAADPPANRAWRTIMTGRTSAAERTAIKHADAVLVENVEMADHVRSIGNEAVHLAPPGIDINRFRPRAEGRPRHGYLLSVCRLNDPRKGLARMVQAYDVMVRRRPDTPHLILAGRGNVGAEVRDLIQRRGLGGRIRIRSDVLDEELADLYRGASVFLQTSYEEGLGISVLEAMACGLPVVATETAGTKETVLDSETGRLVGQDNEHELREAFAESVLNVLGDTGDRYGQAGGRRVATKFSTAATLARFTEIYSILISKGRHGVS